MSTRIALINAEAAKFNAQIENLRVREDEFKKLIDGMQKLKDSIGAEKLELETKLRSLEAERPPVNWLPPELLGDIFLAVVDQEDSETGSTAKPTSRHPTIALSHVCERWRSVALSTPRLWSRISCEGAEPMGDMQRTFVRRSCTAPLDVEYRSLSMVPASMESRHVVEIFEDLSDHLARVRSISFECCGAEAVQAVVKILSTHNIGLRSLSLSITTPRPSFRGTPSLLERGTAREPDDINQAEPRLSDLKSLKLGEVPLFSLPNRLFVNITNLVLSYTPRPFVVLYERHVYQLKMSTLCQFLELTPLLEDFTMSNTVPRFDVFLNEDDMAINPDISTRPRVRLPHLKRLEWSYPYPGEIHWFVTFFDFPALEKLDIWTEEPPARRVTDWHISGHHDDWISHASAKRGRSLLSSLRDLSLQCAGENSLHSFRKFEVPFLQRLEITNADVRTRTGGKPFPSLPRLESILRDPRLLYLTHITLSHFDISPEHGRGEAFLGYMPALRSLSLDSCTGVRKLMESLQRKGVGTLGSSPDDPKGRPLVKMCPRLEAISLWGCEDVNISDVRAVVMARNVRVDEEKELNRSGQVVSESRRMIKPLRATRRRQGRDQAGMNLTPAGMADTKTTSKGALSTANIVYLRLNGCVGISREDALALGQLGVMDIVYDGRGVDS
ncbi:hypothetical protein D9615_009679 [Tricholomella constricta]|uniref:F-box domain-containing protein n=1 Tax=Tricholomella constricta TaxID=117010 RepID=A0A8H5GV65_9AGAR|nr:hypothetical protein D9615_009679 [Tricholomella constricta]